MRKKIFGIIAVITMGVMLVASLAACNTQTQQTTTASEATAAAETTTAAQTTTATEATTAAQTTAAAETTAASPSDTPAVIDDVDSATRALALERAGSGSVVISSEQREGTIGGYTGVFYRIGVRDASGNITYYNGKSDFVYTDAEVAEINDDYDDDDDDDYDEPDAINDVDEDTRELALALSGPGSVVISSEQKEGTIGGYTGVYYRIGVRDASGNVTYFNGKPDFVYTDEEVEALNKEYGN